jgi:hypothetical protein
MRAYAAMMRLWRSSNASRAAWDRLTGQLREELTAQLMAVSHLTANIEEHVASMLDAMLVGGGAVNLFLFQEGALRTWHQLPSSHEEV